MMAEYIKLEDAIAVIEEKQKELCPVGRYGRGYVYGTDREKYDELDEIIDALENIPSAAVAPVVHGRWISWEKAGNCVPSPDRHECSVCHDAAQVLVNGFELLSDYCPNCGAKMDGDRKDGGDG